MPKTARLIRDLSKKGIFCVLNSRIALITAAVLFSLEANLSILGEDAYPLTPEEISGVSVKEMDGLHQMSHDYAVSPQGLEVPQTEDDTWLPDFSLDAQTTSETESRILKNQKQKPQSLNPQAPQETQKQNLSHASYEKEKSPNSAGKSDPITQTSALTQSSAYDSGFTVSPSASSNKIPTPPTQKETQFLTAPHSEPSVDSEDNDEGFANSGSVLDSQESMSEPIHSPASSTISPEYSLAEIPNSLDAPDYSQETPDSIRDSEMDSVSETDPENLIIADIKCSEGMEIPISRFNELIKTKIGNKFSQQVLEEDKRRLLQTKQYVDVTVSTTLIPEEPDKVIVNFDFTPRRQMKYIKVIGNRKMSKTEILEELNMKRGESRMDPYDVENGRIRIVELYKSKNLSEPHVEILKGDRPDDIGVVYLIDEGIKQRVYKTEFVGNTLTSSGHLRSLVTAKPGFLYFIGGEFSRERLDEDVTKLLEYYRNLGYFDAQIDREYEEGDRYRLFNQENEWITVRYIINEGPRYKIRHFFFEGNRVISTDELHSKLKVKENSFFNHNQIEGDRIALKYAYGERGYVLADITPTQIFTEDEGMIDIRYDVKEDYRYRVKDIKIKYEGEESRTKASVVMNMLDFAPGQILNDQKIKSSETTLRRSGYFNDKPSEGPLPTVSIIPEDQNLYFAERTENADGMNRGSSPANSNQEESSLSGEKANTSDEKSKKKDKKFKFLGQMPDGESSSLSQNMNSQKTGETVYYQSVSRTEASTAEKMVSFDVSGQRIPQEPRGFGQIGVLPSEKDSNAKTSESAPLVRGQSMEVPTRFGSTTRQAASTSAGTSAWNGSDYVSYQQTQGSSASGSVNPYADTSMYNNSASALTPSSSAPSAAAPPMTASNLGIYSQTTLGADPSQPDIPGFAAAGRDAVFPGTQEQQYLDGQLWGETGEPVRDATVVANIMEGRTGLFQASIGVNSNYGLVGNVSFTERNFDIMKWPTAFWRTDGWVDAFRGGGQIFRAEASPGTNYSRYSLSWDVPYIFDTNYNFGVTGLYADRYYDYWDDSRYGGELRLGRQWTPRFSTTVNGGAYDIRIHNPDVNWVPDINEVLGHNQQYLVGLNACYDTRNHPYMPSKGYVIQGGAEQIFGSYKYPRVNLDGRTYFTLHKRVDDTGRMVLGLRSAAGWTGDATPIYDRYFGGGYQNLRGFEYREVTPRYMHTKVGIGGYFEFYNSAELLVPVSGGDEFQLAFFLDTGTVSESISKWGTYRIAPGVGMRISIPMLGPAPLALDFAFPVSKSDEDETEIFSFSISGSR